MNHQSESNDNSAVIPKNYHFRDISDRNITQILKPTRLRVHQIVLQIDGRVVMVAVIVKARSFTSGLRICVQITASPNKKFGSEPIVNCRSGNLIDYIKN